MRYFCDEHGKWNCPKYHDEYSPEVCRRCGDDPVYAEGMCYICYSY